MTTSDDIVDDEKTPVVLVLGGLDPSGGAGLAADMLAIRSQGVTAWPIATTLTVQNSAAGEASYPVDKDIIRKQINCLCVDGEPDMVKLGAVGSAAVIEVVAGFIEKHAWPLVFDPVLITSSGLALVDKPAVDLLIELLIPLSFVLTPNSLEAARLTGLKVTSKEEAELAAMALQSLGADNILLTGGHLETSDDKITDYLYNGVELKKYSSKRRKGSESRGTGCLLASAIAGCLAKGDDVGKAVKRARKFTAGYIERAGTGRANEKVG